MLLDIRPDYLQIVQDILQKHVPQYEVWAFGSRAKWTAKEYSDLDLCIVSDKPLSFSVLGAMEEDFSESDLPWKVDVVDWATTSPSFRKIIESQKVLIQSDKHGVVDGWKFVRLIECTSDGNLSYGIVQPGQHTEKGIPVVRVNNFDDTRLNLQSVLRVSPEIEEKHRRTRLQGGEVLLTLVGSVGQSVVAPSELAGWNVARAIAVIRPHQDVGADWINICLQTKAVKQFLDERANTTVQKTLNLADVKEVLIPIPPKDTKREIEAIYMVLTNKIALLRETNATLEAIAQALFKSWFVNFDPVRAKAEGREPEGIPSEIAALFPCEFEDSVLGETPKGWSVVSIGDVADVVKGKSYKSSELVESDTALVTLKSFTRGGGFRTDGFKGFSGSYKQEQVVKPGDCIVAYTDVTQQAEVIGRAAMVLPSSEHTTLVASLDVGIVRPKIEHLTTAFLYFLLRGERYVSHIFGYTSGTTVLHLAKEGLPTYQFILPPASLLQKFEEVAIPMMEQMAGNYLQTIELASLRDSLLPRLMSGKLSLSTAGI